VKIYKHIAGSLVALDGLAIGLAMVLSYYLSIGGNFVRYSGPQDGIAYLSAALLIVPLWLASHAIGQLYSPDVLFDGLDEYANVIRASAFGIVALSFVSFWNRSFAFSRGWVVITWLLCLAMVLFGRFLFRQYIYRSRARGRLQSFVMIAGASEQATALARRLQRTPNLGAKVVGFLDDHLPAGTVLMQGCKVLGPPRDIEYLAAQSRASEVIIVPDALAWESLQEIVSRTATLASLGVRIRLSPGVYESLTIGVNMYRKASIPLLTINDIRFAGSDAALKGLIDYVLSAALFLISLPFICAAAVALKISGAPQVIERRKILGLKGVPFTQYKFYTGVASSARRTLARNSLQLNAHTFAGDLGRLLYVTGFDKALQLWNVLRGEMSLVGSRPLSATTSDAGSSSVTRLLTIKPGMTGLWALSDDTTVDYELRSTVYYIRNWDILLDGQILLRTLAVASFGTLRTMHIDGDSLDALVQPPLVTRAATPEAV